MVGYGYGSFADTFIQSEVKYRQYYINIEVT